jgi:hypothetical protein
VLKCKVYDPVNFRRIFCELYREHEGHSDGAAIYILIIVPPTPYTFTLEDPQLLVHKVTGVLTAHLSECNK